MPAKDFDPLHLDVAAFARADARLEGVWPLAGMERMAREAHEEAPVAETAVTWSAEGELRPRPGDEPQVWLHLRARTSISLECQRCLRPVAVALDVDRQYRFERDETRAAEADLDSEEDVLALTRSLDLHALVEDELLLALPIVPRHADCAMPLGGAVRDADFDQDEEPRPNPFAALAALKKTPKA